ncbi:hypothetical protein GOBAR_DD33877 [Gossypium barbadense]|nr:hypothetical protein GOBAR_DD33877 [Gossypium barbadense]
MFFFEVRGSKGPPRNVFEVIREIQVQFVKASESGSEIAKLLEVGTLPYHRKYVPGRVRVAVRLRPHNAEESVADADFADCVELQPELKRLKLRKNNWDTDTYEFDEGVLDGYNGTIMAYGQTGTGKTYTLGRLGEEDIANRGIMVRAMEDILAEVSPEIDSVLVSYLQLYMESLQDLLDPTNDNISIVEEPKSGDVSLPGATLVEIRDQQSFMSIFIGLYLVDFHFTVFS